MFDNDGCGGANGGSSDDDEDDVGWFFGESEPLPAICTSPSTGPTEATPPEAFGSGEPKSLDSLCEALRHRCMSATDPEGRGQRGDGGRHYFVYAAVRPHRAPLCALVPGIVCHVPQDCCVLPALPSAGTSLCGASLNRLPQIYRAAFIDGDLQGAAYESCAPADRRVVEALVLAEPRPYLAAKCETQLAEAVQVAMAAQGLEAIFLSGEASPAVESACRRNGALLVMRLPARLLHALAEEAGTEVLHGLPVGLNRLPWLSQGSLQCEVRQLAAQQRCSCFSFPLLGYLQPLLPHQYSVGEDMALQCWELRASSVVGNGGAVWTAVLEASCEPTLRQLHAEVSDRLFCAMRESEGAAIGETRRLPPRAGAWAHAVAARLAATEVASLEAAAGAQIVAPWLTTRLADSAAGESAALSRFSEAFLRIAEEESQGRVADNEYTDLSLPPAQSDTVDAVCTVMRRAVRAVEILINLEEFG